MSYSIQALCTGRNGPCSMLQSKNGFPTISAARRHTHTLTLQGYRVDSAEIIDDEGEVVDYWERPGLEKEIASWKA